jgi:hypothetical protein
MKKCYGIFQDTTSKFDNRKRGPPLKLRPVYKTKNLRIRLTFITTVLIRSSNFFMLACTLIKKYSNLDTNFRVLRTFPKFSTIFSYQHDWYENI